MTLSETDALLYRYAEKWGELIHRIHSLPGFHHFLLTSPISTFRTATAECPVVIINSSKFRSTSRNPQNSTANRLNCASLVLGSLWEKYMRLLSMCTVTSMYQRHQRLWSPGASKRKWWSFVSCHSSCGAIWNLKWLERRRTTYNLFGYYHEWLDLIINVSNNYLH